MIAADAALVRWAQTVPEIRCAAPVFAPWTGATASSTGDIPARPVDAARFAATMFAEPIVALTVVGGGGSGATFWAGRAPAEHALVLHAGSEAEEYSFTAVVREPATPSPRRIGALAHAPRAGTIGLGSTRAEVERVLAPAQAVRRCDDEVVRYEPRPAGASEASVWLFYRAGRVVAIARYEAV